MADKIKNEVHEVSTAENNNKLVVDDKIIRSIARCLLPLLRNYYESNNSQNSYKECESQSET